jgi:hypothetical protein
LYKKEFDDDGDNEVSRKEMTKFLVKLLGEEEGSSSSSDDED